MITSETESIAVGVPRISCAASGTHHATFAVGEQLYVWDVPSIADALQDGEDCCSQPWPPTEMPGVIQGLCMLPNDRVLVVTSNAIVLLRVEDGGETVTEGMALVPSVASPAGVVVEVVASPSGHLAVVLDSSGKSTPLMIIGIGEQFMRGKELGLVTLNLESHLRSPPFAGENLRSSVASTSSSAGDSLSVQDITFSAAALMGVSRDGTLITIPTSILEQRLLDENCADATFLIKPSACGQLGPKQSVTTAMFDDVTNMLVVGLNDGTVLGVDAGSNGSVISSVNLLPGLQRSIDADEALDAPGMRVDISNIHAHPTTIVPFGGSLLVGTQVALVCLTRTDLTPTQHFLYTSGFSPNVSLSHTGVALIEFPIETKLVLQRYGLDVAIEHFPSTTPIRPLVVTANSITPRPVSVGHIPRPSLFSLPAHSDVSGDDDRNELPEYDSDAQSEEEGICAKIAAEGGHYLPTAPSLVHATLPLPSKYLEPLKLVDPGSLMAPKPIAGVAKKPPLPLPPKVAPIPPMFSKGAKNPNLNSNVKKPVTFRKTVASSGYTANLPWSEQQRLKEKAKRTAAAAKKNPPSSVAPKMYDIASGYPEAPKERANALLVDPKVHQGAVNSLCFDGEGRFLVSGSTDGTISMLKCPVVANNGVAIVARGHKGLVSSVDVSLETTGAWGPMVLSAGSEIAMWHPAKREQPFVMENVTAGKPSASICAAKYFYMDRLVVAGVGSSLQFYKYILDSGGGDLDRFRNWSRLESAGTYRTDAQSVTALDCINHTLSTVVVWAGSNKEVGVVDVATEKTIRRIQNAHDRPIHSLEMMTGSRYSPVSNDHLHRFATSGFDSLTKVWDLRCAENDGPTMVLSRHENWGIKVGMCFSPCGKFFVMGSQDCAAYVYDLRMVGDESGGQPVLARLKTPDAVTSCRFHPLTPTVALGTSGGDVRFFGTAAQ